MPPAAPRARAARAAGALVAAAVALAGAVAGPASAYRAPPPDPGFEYILDGTEAGSAASFDQWVYVSYAGPASSAQDRWLIDAATGAVDPNGTPLGALWYARRPFGNATLRLEFAVADTPSATRNGGVMVRAPGDPRLYVGPNCARVTPPLFGDPLGLRGGPADTGEPQMRCGHEIQVNETLTGGGPEPSTDARKTGSVYGFADLNAAQSRTYERLEKGVWHELEIRMIGQQFTVLIDGVVVNQFDNALPRLASRAGDLPTAARQQPAGYVGLQSHGGTDRILYREVQVREYAEAEIPEAIEPPHVAGRAEVGRVVRCREGRWDLPGARVSFDWYRANPAGRFARTQKELGYRLTPPRPDGRFGTDRLSWLGPQHVGRGRRYRLVEADVGKVVYCQVSATRAGATAFARAAVGGIRLPCFARAYSPGPEAGADRCAKVIGRER